ncbi:DNA polymerase III subunit gamma/tau [Helicobacter sp. 13S00477-4]|uniref:DNA polymerase III subunit gamma/tau n=1 Tax=Helicobacter sp. 13S00477-4 TaxID=1905759 RepID=UPI0026BC6C48
MALALALKYRPVDFGDLIGQESVSQTLSLALDHSRISHAYLFSGLRGSGKTSSARIFSRALQCDKGPTSTPCGECVNCKSALEGRHLDIIEMDAASSRKIDDIRDLIEQTKYYPAYGRYKIFIIDEVHMLTKEAFNALLKTLEEPPDYVKFILATTDPLKLPATILSRTQHFRFKKIPQKAVVAHIGRILDKEGVAYEAQALEIIARSGAGSLRDTLTITDQAINFCNKHIATLKVTEMLGVVDPQTLREFFNAIFKHDEQKLQEILNMLEEYECEMIIDEMMLFLKEALRIKDKDFSVIIIDRFLRILSESKYLLSLNTDGGFVLLLLSMKMQEAMKVKDIDFMIKELESNLSFPNSKKPQESPSDQDIQNQDLAPTEAPSPKNSLFETLIAKIYDRNKQLGEIFEKNIKFISFQDSNLIWSSMATGEDKSILVQNWAHIKMMVQEIYGISTKINPIQAPKDSTQTEKIEDLSLSKQTSSIKKESKETIAENIPKSSEEIFLEENKELIRNIKTHLGATKMIPLQDKKEY